MTLDLTLEEKSALMIELIVIRSALRPAHCGAFSKSLRRYRATRPRSADNITAKCLPGGAVHYATPQCHVSQMIAPPVGSIRSGRDPSSGGRKGCGARLTMKRM
jgi:hypothetical protein